MTPPPGNTAAWGIGLSIAQDIARLHAGRIADQRSGHGTTFRFTPFKKLAKEVRRSARGR